METVKTNNNKVLGAAAICVNLIAFLYKGMLGQRAGWEMLLPIVLAGLVLAIVTVIKKGNGIAWAAIGAMVLSLAAFFLG